MTNWDHLYQWFELFQRRNNDDWTIHSKNMLRLVKHLHDEMDLPIVEVNTSAGNLVLEDTQDNSKHLFVGWEDGEYILFQLDSGAFEQRVPLDQFLPTIEQYFSE